jgi:hypothetical protein
MANSAARRKELMIPPKVEACAGLFAPLKHSDLLKETATPAPKGAGVGMW